MIVVVVEIHGLLGHVHCETERTTVAWTAGMYIDPAAAELDDWFDDCQAQANSFAVGVSRSLQFSETSEQFGKVFFGNTRPCVLDMDD